jgi:phenylalanyl-tRNA synthetase alpha chain
MNELEEKGHLHPLSQVVWRVCGAFRELGFEVAEGLEVEDEFHNFDALNVPADHPARDMQDTFWLKNFPNNL